MAVTSDPTVAPPYPKTGDVWRSRDKRDKGLTVVVIGVNEHEGRVQIKRHRYSSVALRRWAREYEFVSRRAA